MMTEVPGAVRAEMRSIASCGMVMRSSAAAALGWEAAALEEEAIDTAVQRNDAVSSLRPIAVNTWVPSGRSARAISTGVSNSGSNPLRTNSLPSLRLTNTETGPDVGWRGAGGGTTR